MTLAVLGKVPKCVERSNEVVRDITSRLFSLENASTCILYFSTFQSVPSMSLHSRYTLSLWLSRNPSDVVLLGEVEIDIEIDIDYLVY